MMGSILRPVSFDKNIRASESDETFPSWIPRLRKAVWGFRDRFEVADYVDFLASTILKVVKQVRLFLTSQIANLTWPNEQRFLHNTQVSHTVEVWRCWIGVQTWDWCRVWNSATLAGWRTLLNSSNCLTAASYSPEIDHNWQLNRIWGNTLSFLSIVNITLLQRQRTILVIAAHKIKQHATTPSTSIPPNQNTPAVFKKKTIFSKNRF